MKLVELLAKELAEWADTTTCYVQDRDGTAWPCTITPKFDGSQWGADNFIDQREQAEMIEGDLSSDYATAIVTKDQWQAERDRQKGGEWKRHRGGKCPVADKTQVEVKFRDGEIRQSHASDFFGWKHGELDDKAAEVMQYRVINQPQADEVEMIHSQESLKRAEFKLMKPSVFGAISDIPSEAKTDYFDGPLRWRDTVNELDAYIEEFTREREALINRLALEGFALLPAMTPVVGGAAPFSLPYSEWKIGDFVTSKVDYNMQFTKGKKYTVTGTHVSLGENRVSVVEDDKGEANGWLANQFEFHSRP